MASHTALFLFLLIGKLSLHNSSKYLVSASVQLEPRFLLVAAGCGFSSYVVLSLSLLGTELVEGDACGILSELGMEELLVSRKAGIDSAC